jgi:signal transduction histidine kinase
VIEEGGRDAEHGERCEECVAVCAPRGRDAALIAGILGEAGIDCGICPTAEDLCRAIRGGDCGAALVAEESLTRGALESLARIQQVQPPWSDFPFLVLTSGGAASDEELRRLSVLAPLGNVAFLERPVRRITLISGVRAALRARRRQYQVRDHIAARHHAEMALREADRRKDEFLATLAHELRNPMSPLRNGLEILRIAGDDAELVGESLGMMDRQLNQMTRLVDDLFDLSRIGRGKVELRMERLDLSAIVRGAVEASRPTIDQLGHELSVVVPPDPIPVDGDAARLVQVFANLLNNAAKYTRRGGHIVLSVEPRGGMAWVTVEDDGIGIPAHLLPRVFEMFTQGSGSDGPAPSGLGIGLSVVQRLVAMHGGEVEARSDGEDAGSTFIVRLPIATAPSPSVDPVEVLPFPVPVAGPA